MACAHELENDLFLYADFEEVGSIEHARKYITAATRWLISNPVSTRDQSAEMVLQHKYIHEMLLRARDYIAAEDEANSRVNGSVRFLGFSSDWRG